MVWLSYNVWVPFKNKYLQVQQLDFSAEGDAGVIIGGAIEGQFWCSEDLRRGPLSPAELREVRSVVGFFGKGLDDLRARGGEAETPLDSEPEPSSAWTRNSDRRRPSHRATFRSLLTYPGCDGECRGDNFTCSVAAFLGHFGTGVSLVQNTTHASRAGKKK